MRLSVEVQARDSVLNLLPKRSVGVELGVHLGLFARQIRQRVNPVKLHLVDPWLALEDSAHKETWYARVSQAEMDGYHATVTANFDKAVKLGQVEIHRMTSWDAMARFPGNSLDWVYIDADHAFESVARDLKDSFDKVKPSGLIAGDDYKLGGWWGDGIVRAVHEFVASHPVKLVMVLDDQYVIQKLA